MEEELIKCPYCGSTQIVANKKGFSVGKAAVGGILLGGVGLLAGAIGNNNIVITCLKCGKTFSPNDTAKMEENKKNAEKLERQKSRETKIANEAAQLRKEAEIRELTPREQQVIKEDERNQKAHNFANNCIILILVMFLLLIVFLAVKCTL